MEKINRTLGGKNCTSHGGTHKKLVANRKQSRGKSHAKVPLKSVKKELGNAKRCKINGNLCHITSHLIIYVEIIKRNERCFDTTMNSQDGIFVKVLISSCLIVGLPDGTFTQTTSCLCQHAPVNRLLFFHYFLVFIRTRTEHRLHWKVVIVISQSFLSAVNIKSWLHIARNNLWRIFVFINY